MSTICNNGAAGKQAAQPLLVLETYPSREAAYDGLSGLFNEVRGMGQVVHDTTQVSGEKVLVCGIAPLYAGRISPLNTNIIFTTFESDRIPAEWVSAINSYCHCIVSHDEVKKVFAASGVRIPITVVHNGYRRYERAVTGIDPHVFFDVGFLGIPVNRKNLLKLYEACRQLKQQQIPELRLHVHAASFYDWLDPAPFAAMQADEMVCWTTGKRSQEAVAAWYRNLSCYIFPSSGEGWSYTPRESMYLGIPTIISNIPAHRELVASGFFKVIEPAGREPADFGGAIHGCWDRIDVQDIHKAIADVYAGYREYSAMAAAGAEWIKDLWQNEDIGTRIWEVVKTL